MPKILLDKDSVVLAFGDSLTHGFGATQDTSYPAYLQEKSGLRVINAGINGETSAEGLLRLPFLFKEKPDVVILCHGGNDILQKLSHEDLKNNLESMVRLIKESGAQVILVSVPDFNVFGFRALPLYEEIADAQDIFLEDEVLTHIELNRSLKSDYVHPNAKGYEMMADTFLKLLIEP
ncbi:GDSL-type esterase/lipase family protein [Sulfurimonas sp.]|uniref:GDSL-type esterase/lipase family protein n=1 Tax=Sulfurimonas sp. TaxID=2022749 RepID=UPI0025DC7674|nr:GDSL-type esterase/lipase family protein [Sulfurimonas sp.]